MSTGNGLRVLPVGLGDAERFLAFRRDGLASDPGAFRVTPEDDAALGVEAWRARLGRDHVIAVARGNEWLGIGGLARLAGAKLDHKGLIWGMYVRPAARGTGVVDTLMTALLAHAAGRMRQIHLTVMADNLRARAVYERHGFRLYGVEPGSVRVGDGFADEVLMARLLPPAPARSDGLA